VQGVEVGKTVDAQNDCLAIDHELLHPGFQRGLDNPGITLGPIVAVAGDQPDTVAVAFDAQPVAVILDFVDPIRCVRNLAATGRNAKNRTPYS
jgi:hypothetical protein